MTTDLPTPSSLGEHVAGCRYIGVRFADNCCQPVPAAGSIGRLLACGCVLYGDDREDDTCADHRQSGVAKSSPAAGSIPAEYKIVGEYLVEKTGGCTCAAVDIGVGYQHEPDCGWEPIARIVDLFAPPSLPADLRAAVERLLDVTRPFMGHDDWCTWRKEGTEDAPRACDCFLRALRDSIADVRRLLWRSTDEAT